MKVLFIENLKDPLISIEVNNEEYSKLNESEFEQNVLGDFEQREGRWTEGYFNEKSTFLTVNFSRELVEHLLKVKAKLYPNKNDKLVVEGEDVIDKNNQSKTENWLDDNKENDLNTEESVVEQPDLEKILKGFVPQERLVDALNSKDQMKIQSLLINLLNNRRMPLKEVIQSIWFAFSQAPEVFKNFEITAFSQHVKKDKKDWNYDYFLTQQNYLDSNFCLERLLHLFEVREELSKTEPRLKQLELVQPEITENKGEKNQTNKTNFNKEPKDKNFMRKLFDIFVSIIQKVGGIIKETFNKIFN